MVKFISGLICWGLSAIHELIPLVDLYMQLGTLAVLVRQTNIIWILFVACSGIIEHTLRVQKDKHCEQLDDSSVLDQKDGQLALGKTAATRSNLRRRRLSNSVDSSDHSTPRNFSSYSSGLLSSNNSFCLVRVTSIVT